MILKEKNTIWYAKSTIEAIMIGIACICLLGLIVGVIFMAISFPMILGKPISYHPFPWLNDLMGWSVCIGFINFLFMISWEKDWRRDYRDEEDANDYDWGENE
jgi:hypothetical protein